MTSPSRVILLKCQVPCTRRKSRSSWEEVQESSKTSPGDDQTGAQETARSDTLIDQIYAKVSFVGIQRCSGILNRQVNSSTTTLAYGLFACAMLTRDYSLRPDVFFLNLAVGVRLATKMRKVFSDFFNWYNLTLCVPDIQEPLQPTISEVVSKPCKSQDRSTSRDLSCLARLYTKTQFVFTFINLIASPGERYVTA